MDHELWHNSWYPFDTDYITRSKAVSKVYLKVVFFGGTSRGDLYN